MVKDLVRMVEGEVGCRRRGSSSDIDGLVRFAHRWSGSGGWRGWRKAGRAASGSAGIAAGPGHASLPPVTLLNTLKNHL